MVPTPGTPGSGRVNPALKELGPTCGNADMLGVLALESLPPSLLPPPSLAFLFSSLPPFINYQSNERLLQKSKKV